MNTKLFIRKNVQLNRCPACNEIATLRRSRSRNIFERILKKFKYSSYVCRNCGWRGKLFSFKPAKNFLQILVMYIVIVIIVAYIINKFLMNTFQ